MSTENFKKVLDIHKNTTVERKGIQKKKAMPRSMAPPTSSMKMFQYLLFQHLKNQRGTRNCREGQMKSIVLKIAFFV